MIDARVIESEIKQVKMHVIEHLGWGSVPRWYGAILEINNHYYHYKPNSKSL